MTNKEAIEILKKATLFEPTLENRDYPEAFDLAIKALEERPQGKWIWITEPDGFLHSKCSRCNQFNDWGDVPYCPWCGAKMGNIK